MKRKGLFAAASFIVISAFFLILVGGERTLSHTHGRFSDRSTAEYGVNIGDNWLSPTLTPCPYVGSCFPSNFPYVTDGAYNSVDGTIFFVETPTSGDAIFQFDPVSCTIVTGTTFSVNSGTPQKAIAFDADRYEIWVGGYDDFYINQYAATPPYNLISSNYLGVNIASAAIDDANDFLFIGIRDYPDMLYVYDIIAGLGSLLGGWVVEWQGISDGSDMAGMSFDDDSDQLVMINSYAWGYGEDRESFDFDISNGLTGAGRCTLDDIELALGLAIIEDGDAAPGSFRAYIPDLLALSANQADEVHIYGQSVFPPQNVVCTYDNDVELNWTNSDPYDAINISRDGELIATLPGNWTNYLDTEASIGLRVYAVTGLLGSNESDPAECEVVVGHSWEVRYFDFDSYDGGFSTGGSEECWEWTNQAWKATGCTCSWLMTPRFRFGSEGGWLWLDVVSNMESYWEGWNAQVSINNGATWSVIYPINGYDQGPPYWSCPEGLGGDTNSGISSVRFEFDLSSYVNARALIRFLFEGSGNQDSYLIIDNVCVSGLGYPPHERTPAQW